MVARILIDTDPGLDDAVAILFALSHPALGVLGLTTVGGNIGLGRTTRNALRLLAVCGRADLPVTAGADRPLARPAFPGEALHGADGLGGVALPEPLAEAGTGAAAFLARTIGAHPPGAVTLCALGPLTNVARLLADHPGTAGRLGGIVAMGGALEAHGNAGGRAEFNLHCDPEAAAAVLASGVPLTLIPLDVTRQVRASAADTRRLARGATPAAHAAGALIGAYFAERAAESRPLHDPLVPLFVLRPDLFDCGEMSLAVALGEEAGALVPGPHPVRVARGIGAGGALEALLSALEGQPEGSSRSTSATQKATPAGIASSQKS